MSGEKYQFDEVSTILIESLFDKLREHTSKEFGSGWERRRLGSVLATKTLSIYIQPNAEELINEYVMAEVDPNLDEEQLDAEMTFDKRTETREIEVSFEAERGHADEDDTEISTTYTLRLISSSPLDDVIDVPEQVRDKVRANLLQAEENHTQKVNDGEMSEDSDFDSTIAFSKHHKFVLGEMKESLNYSVEHHYDGCDFNVPMLSYEPDEDKDASSADSIMASGDDLPGTEHIDNQQERNDTLALFEELMKHQDIEKPVAQRPAELRVSQILAILAILQFGEAQNEEQEAIIKDLI
jgi:hypothetical protein